MPADDGFRWTSKYLRTNPKIREVVDTLLELTFMPPHSAVSVGKVHVSIVSCPEGETYLSNKYLVVKVTGAFGWTFEFTVRPYICLCLSCFVCLFLICSPPVCVAHMNRRRHCRSTDVQSPSVHGVFSGSWGGLFWA
jgi:hypothetical protein